MELSRQHFLLLCIFLFSLSSKRLVSSSQKLPINKAQTCLRDQKTILMQLQQDILNHTSSLVTFNENSYMKVSKWSPRTDCCKWDGVTCDLYGHVISLNLSYSMLSGHIDSIFNLRHLQSLNLARNNFQLTPIPPGFDKLSNLTHLNLSYSCFSDQIPVGISKLTRLTSLDLSTISFCELPPTFNDSNFKHIFRFEELHRLRLEKPNLGSFVENLSALTEVYLDAVDLSAQGSNWAQALSNSLPNLRVLSLSYCHLSGPIHSSFEKLKSLQHIRLNGNNLSSEVPYFLATFRNLEVLNLASAQLYGNFPEDVFLLPRLRSIDLSKNGLLSGQLPEFHVRSSLQLISLYETNFQGKLSDSIGNLQSLTTLLLNACNFSGLIPPSLANLTNVIELDISYNQLKGPLPPFRTNNVPKLVDLRLSNNFLTGTIDSSLFTLLSMKVLYLDGNYLSGQLDEFVAASSMLEKVYLNGNALRGPIPSSIANIASISVLSLASNHFSGTLKLDVFGNLKNLTSLDLSGNDLTIEADQSNIIFPHLDELKLSKCNLSEIPTFLRKHEQLRYLNLSYNQIRGYIPDWLWTSALNELDLSYNPIGFVEIAMQGGYDNNSFSPLGKLVMRSCNVLKFPDFLKVLDSLWYLDFSDNRIDGGVPSWIWKSSLQYVNISHNSLSSMEEFAPDADLSSLETLDLRGNLIEGSLPRGICNLSSLSIFDASHNHLGGQIPECLGTLSNLSVLNFQGNNYRHIPSDFSMARSLRSLNINGNLLEGQVPKTLAKCTMLEVLDLGNNMLFDTFPFWLGDLPNLKVLVLQNNRFYGEIQLPRRNYSLPKLVIVDLSSNQFTGKLSKEFFGSLKEMAINSENNSIPKQIGRYEYYQDSVTIMSKGFQMVLVRILTIYVSLDISNNRFHGNIPEEIGALKSLVIFNLSHNAFEGNMPSSLGYLAKLESLDLSRNKLSGIIPQELTSLTFLAVLNLSYNNLTGRIPQGYQFNTFSNDSYMGNSGLCGLPLSRKCTQSDDSGLQPPSEGERSEDETLFNWTFAGAGYGSGVLIGFLVGYIFLSEVQLFTWLAKLKRKLKYAFDDCRCRIYVRKINT